MLVAAEEGVQALLLLVGEQVSAGVQGPPRTVERKRFVVCGHESREAQVVDDGGAATAMLGAWLRAARRLRHGGELEQAAETRSGVEFCRGCRVRARLHGQRPTGVRNLPSGGRPVTLVYVKRVWRCAERACPAGTWSETSGHVQAGRR